MHALETFGEQNMKVKFMYEIDVDTSTVTGLTDEEFADSIAKAIVKDIVRGRYQLAKQTASDILQIIKEAKVA